MKKEKLAKISLNRETLRKLEPDQLREPLGGALSVSCAGSCLRTCSCMSTCC